MASVAHASSKPARRWVKWVWIALALVVVAAVAAFAWDAFQLKDSSAELKVHAAEAQQAVKTRDAEALTGAVSELQASAGAFANATDGPHWWVANHLPWIKNQTVPLSEAGKAVRAIADDALAPLASMGNLEALQAPAIVDGRIDPHVLEPYRETLAQAAAVTTAQQEALDAVDLSGTVEQVRTPFVELRTDLATLGGTIQGGHVAAEVLPTMLGAEGERTYLVMVQNNAEPRATGGIPGAVLQVTVTDGRISFDRYVSASSLADAVLIPGPLTDDEERIFTERMLRYPQDINFTPELPRSAILMEQYWHREFGEAVDGIISIDPVALGYMLQGMPATDIGGITITAENLSSVMLNQAYLAFPDPDDSDAFFALASQQLFGQLISGSTSSIAGVEQAIDEGRFMAWSANADEQSLLATTPVAGGFLERTDTIGLFLNDGSGSKIGYYIDASTQVVDHVCTDGTVRGETITVTYTHTFEGDVEGLPEYVAGGWLEPVGEFHANVLLYPATGFGVTAVTFDGEAGTLQGELHDGRLMSTARIVLRPGQTLVVQYQLEATEHGLLAPKVVVTPGARQHPIERVIDDVESGC